MSLALHGDIHNHYLTCDGTLSRKCVSIEQASYQFSNKNNLLRRDNIAKVTLQKI